MADTPTDYWHNLVKSIFSYNRWLVIALIVGVTWNIAGGAWFEPKVVSPYSGKKVTQTELIAERNVIVAALEKDISDINSQIDRHVLEAELLQKAAQQKADEFAGVDAQTDTALEALRAERERLSGILGTLLNSAVAAYPAAGAILPFKDDLMSLVIGGLILDTRRKSGIIKAA